MPMNANSLLSQVIHKSGYLKKILPIDNNSSQAWQPEYLPQYLSHVTKVLPNGTVNLRLVVYLPHGNHNPDQFSVEVRIGETEAWQPLNPPDEQHPYWWLDCQEVAEGTPLQFRYQKSGGEWQAIAPLNELANRYQNISVPALEYEWENDPPVNKHGRVLMETTLEGLLAGYKDGKYAPNNLEEGLANQSIANRILKTDIPGCLAELGIDEIMAPVGASVANRSELNPQYNYLTYNFVELDWQFGSPQEFKRLIDQFYGEGLKIIPDLIFAHQVYQPFPGSMDQIEGLDTSFVDQQAYLFRDYGTWMLNLAVPEIRRMLVEKIVSFITKYHLKMIRIDYVDGLVLQYSNREQNYAEQFLKELKAELRAVCPDVVTLGETFEVSHNEVVQDFIDVFYAPMGFSIVEELYKPVAKRDNSVNPNVSAIANHINQVVQSRRPEAFYAQLHDETWFCPHIAASRPDVHWAYGEHPAQLAKNQGDELVEMGELASHNLLDYVRRTVRNAEALTMFIANLRYMFTPGVDSLSLGALDDQQQWKFSWEGVSPQQVETWQKTGLSRATIYHFHQQHRHDMIQLRQIFRHYTKLDGDDNPQVFSELHHYNDTASLLSIFRRSYFSKEESLLIVFNLGNDTFQGEQCYELPAPEGFWGQWKVLFDGEAFSARSQSELQAFQTSNAYQEGTVLDTISGQYSNIAHVIPLTIGARSLIVLQYYQE